MSEEDTSSVAQAGSQLNGSQLNGSQLNGSQLNGMTLLGFLFDGATQDSVGLTNLRVDKGELIAEQGATTLRGSAFIGTRIQATARNLANQTSATVTYRITNVQPETGYDPTNTGSTFLYTIEYWNTTTSAWEAGCPQDPNGQRYAIPVSAEWDETGTRSDSSTMFTLACTSGVIAKCYRWGYRPWVTGYGDLSTMHYACTRLARADFCGNGVSHTTDGTLINVWDSLPTPIQTHDAIQGMEFDSGWDTTGATCLSDARWSVSGAAISSQCPGKLPAPGSGGTACNSASAATSQKPSTLMFKESNLVQ